MIPDCGATESTPKLIPRSAAAICRLTILALNSDRSLRSSDRPMDLYRADATALYKSGYNASSAPSRFTDERAILAILLSHRASVLSSLSAPPRALMPKLSAHEFPCKLHPDFDPRSRGSLRRFIRGSDKCLHRRTSIGAEPQGGDSADMRFHENVENFMPRNSSVRRGGGETWPAEEATGRPVAGEERKTRGKERKQEKWKSRKPRSRAPEKPRALGVARRQRD